MTDEEFEKLGKSCRDAEDGNLIVGSFAASMIGEDYPFSKGMCQILFASFSDTELGKKFAEWAK